MTDYGVSKDSLRVLRQAMRRAKILEKDIQEQFVHSSGRGGQNVNKVATCVFLRHTPSEISVKCQKTRQQGRNRFLARELLLKKVVAQEERLERERIRLVEKQKRQKRKRSKKAKEKTLEGKRYQSRKKQERRKIDVRGID